MELSRPYQVLLAGAAAFAVLWFVVLKPGSGSSASPPTAPATRQLATPAPAAAPTHGERLPGGLGRAVSAAHGAARTADQANARAGVDPTAGGASRPAAPASPAPPSSASARATVRVPAVGPPAVSGVQAMVLLFYNPRSADDQAVRRELGSVDTRHGAVVTRAVPVSQLFRYRAVLNGTAVAQTPTILVLSSRHSALELTGLVDAGNIQQAVREALLP